jgi:hypothetical protein
MSRIIIILWLVFSLITKAEEASQTETSEGIEHITGIIDRLNLVFAKYHLAPLAFDPSEVRLSHPHEALRNVDVCRFYALSKISVDLLPKTFEPIAFYNDNIKYDQGPGYDQPPKPKWTEEQAIAIGEEYIKAILGQFPQNEVGPPTVEFEKRRNVIKHTSVWKYFVGRWHIRWPRFDAKGYPFNEDSITIYISEDQGLATAFINFFSNYQEPLGPLISKDDALKIANLTAQALVDKWLGGGLQLGAPTKIEEGIVNSNHILQAQTVADLAHKDTTARLAWVIIYSLTANGAPAPERRIYLEVDAQTKEIIGGDFH